MKTNIPIGKIYELKGLFEDYNAEANSLIANLETIAEKATVVNTMRRHYAEKDAKEEIEKVLSYHRTLFPMLKKIERAFEE